MQRYITNRTCTYYIPKIKLFQNESVIKIILAASESTMFRYNCYTRDALL